MSSRCGVRARWRPPLTACQEGGSRLILVNAGQRGVSREQNEDKPVMWWSPHPFSGQNVPRVVDRDLEKGQIP